jgi:Ca-activated chloride channel family protein
MIRARIGAARLFTVGIGPAPNAYFMQEAAAAGRGSYTFIAQREQVGERMQDLFRKLEHPALVNLELRWPGGEVADLAQSLPGDLYVGDPLVIVARLKTPPQGMVTLTGSVQGAAWVHQLPMTVVGENAGLAKLWGRERITQLSRQRNAADEAERTQLQATITQVALAAHLVSEFTSLVAVDVTPVRPLDALYGTEQVPTSAPRGSFWAGTTGFAQTATPAPLLWLLGLSALGVALVLQLRTRNQ